MSVPVRHVVELRPPRKGERYVFYEDQVVVAQDPYRVPRWVIVDSEPTAEAQS